MKALSKSRFKQGLECPNKLFFSNNKEVYHNVKNNDTFLQALASGGFQVEEYARVCSQIKMNIKSTLIIILTICTIQMSFSQNELKIEKPENDRLIKVLNNSELIGENRENYLSIRIYTIDNGTGSAGFESCEVSHNLLIAVSEFDEVLSFCVYNNLNPLFCSF